MKNNINNVEVKNLKQNVITEIKNENTKLNNNAFDKVKNLFPSNKLMSVKGVKIIIPLILLVVLFIAYTNLTSTKKSSSNSPIDNSISFTNGLAYISEIENKLTNVLSNIKGAGKTKVMISISAGPVLTIANNIEEKKVSTSSGTTVTTVSEPIIITKNGESMPLILMETLPEINGVIVVCEGADDVKIKMDIITAIKTVLNISSGSIEVFSGE